MSRLLRIPLRQNLRSYQYRSLSQFPLPFLASRSPSFLRSCGSLSPPPSLKPSSSCPSKKAASFHLTCRIAIDGVPVRSLFTRRTGRVRYTYTHVGFISALLWKRGGAGEAAAKEGENKGLALVGNQVRLPPLAKRTIYAAGCIL